MPQDRDLIWIQDATEVYDKSRTFLDGLVDEGKLERVTFEGDRRVYLRRSQLNTVLNTPHVERRGQETA